MSESGVAHRSRVRALGDYYWSSVRRAVQMVQDVPDWPSPARLLAQAIVAIVGVTFVPVSWIYKTVVPFLRLVVGAPSQGGSPSGPPRGPMGRA
jgi:hypothetical protein